MLADYIDIYGSTNNIILTSGVNRIIDRKYFEKVIFK